MKCFPCSPALVAIIVGVIVSTFLVNGQPMVTTLAAPRTAAVSCAPDSGTGSISGTVTAPGGIPVERVSVEAYTTYGKRVDTASTDASGNYALSGLITGAYLLYFDTDFTGTAYTPEWYDNQSVATAATPVAVTDGVATTGIDVELVAGTQFSGQVTGEDGMMLQSVNVQVYDSSGQIVARASTDAAGNYTTTPGVPSGSYRIFFDSPIGKAYLAEYYNDTASLDEATALNVTAPDPQPGVDAVLAPAARISGRVTDAATGDPLPTIGVNISGPGGSNYLTTDSDGNYTSYAGLQSGVYTVSFGPIFDSQNYIRTTQTVSVTAPDLLTGVDAALSSGGMLTGKVTAPDATPLQAVSVFIRNEDGSYQEYVSTDTTGVYSANSLPSGAYTLFFRKDGYIREVYDDKPDFQAADQVAVTAPETTSGIDAVLLPGGAISGTVTDATTGDPIEGVFVEILDEDGGRVEATFTDAMGKYTVPATLLSGTYRVRFNPDDRNTSCAYALEYYNDKSIEENADLVTVTAPNTTENIDAQLTQGSIIFGTVTNAATGTPLEGISVSVYDADNQWVASGRTSFLGGYLTSPALPSGDYTVQFRDFDSGYIDEYYDDQLAQATATVIAVTAPNDVTGIDAALARGGTISGQVTAADTGEPLAYVSVTVYDRSGTEVAYASTAMDGSYTVTDGLPTGDYRLKFRLPGGFEELAFARTQGQAAADTVSEVTLAQGDLELPSGYLTIFYPDKLTLAAATPVRVTAPNETTGSMWCCRVGCISR